MHIAQAKHVGSKERKQKKTKQKIPKLISDQFNFSPSPFLSALIPGSFGSLAALHSTGAVAKEEG